jgi:hypothetical protein
VYRVRMIEKAAGQEDRTILEAVDLGFEFENFVAPHLLVNVKVGITLIYTTFTYFSLLKFRSPIRFISAFPFGSGFNALSQIPNQCVGESLHQIDCNNDVVEQL